MFKGRFLLGSAFFILVNMEGKNMSDNHHHEHHEDPSVCYRVALVFVAVIAVIAIIGVFN